ncbi:MAG: hypothetical protein ACD_66C00091G0004 [uncultured bacterium]|uniref:FecR protein domain-containing protein n=1 Tax=Candidatus Uhrbacteria bacterium GW2011_GWC1_41_20 TaxID=1618983 RepID=A0A0G0VDM3_9BACT|nr:MAG: hypothetical protein ACD_66C00091G0004 [uncultured bacterium]KKR22295.1 MAG: hypothetical protein UT52_C0017G0010 [Candidatus Uhrbacteria bacterium GW2011_GWE1_39_46]KKR63486.1 MAG: hypothetical protein UU04_C0017G0014 [Candidatus Uhrbacteria bacterium GW2011_GWC2_40_450]KKR89700.1 MAG: hypothetical protein UU40_C0017G0014 [Candidatus Uhrbacteria bacterium GW2011_GWD2_41_121]KKR95866.1 MAG: hypothetical protein UU46_C0012G0019 [Candidatus Uhrbacteria bacterium GW2011_GWD1_41_16]KKR9899
MNICKFITLNKILIISIIAIASGLLVYNRVATETHMSAVNIESGEIIKRGEIMTTLDQYASFKISNTTIYLAKNTELKLANGRAGNLDLQLIQGRIVVTGQSNISIREVDVKLESDARASIVHYSWLNEIEVAPLNGPVSVCYDEQSRALNTQAIRMSTLAPYATEFIDFNPSQSSEKEFYDWIGFTN